MNKKRSLSELNRLSIEAYKAAKKHPITVVLDNIRSMHNVGAFFRTADAFRIEKLILGGYTPQPPHRDIHKTAIGATETVDWAHCEDTVKAVMDLKEQGYIIYSIEQTQDSMELQNVRVDTNSKICVVFGNEVGGVDQTIIDQSDVCIEIPQYGTKHSLNVSVCAGIGIWEFTKHFLSEK